LGDAALGLELLKTPSFAKRLVQAGADVAALVERHLRPQPRLALAPLLLAHARAAMDLSDGLVKDCRRMCAASRVGARLGQRDIPLSSSLEKAGSDWRLKALTGGDDYEILAAIPEEHVAKFLADACTLEFRVTHIGEITEGAGVTVEGADGAAISFDRAGWDHFA
jgi:thiamine-monophosphate kinase